MKNKALWANLSLLGSGLALIAAFGFWFVQRELVLGLQISIALIVIFFALFIYFDPARARSLFTGRQARYGSNAFILFAAFFGILVVVNYLVYENAQDWGLRWDLTEDQERTLAPETIETLETLETPVVVRAFYTETNAGRERAQDLLDDFQFYSKGNFLYEFIDPNANPLAAQEAGITQDGTLVFTFGEGVETVTVISEAEFTNAILRLRNPGEKGVYFLTGHGEYSLDQSGDTSLTQLKRALENKNYVVSGLNLLIDPVIPEDAIALVIAGPLQPLTEPEMALIAAYVAAGGSLIVAEEPVPLTEFGATVDPVAEYLLETWGITMGNDLVVDVQAIQVFNSPFIAISAQYGPHPITDDLLERQLASIFPLARSVRIASSDNPEITQIELILTSDQSWAETNFDSVNDGTLEPDDQDLAGPVSLAVAASNGTTGARVVVFGDVDFFADANLAQFGNQDLILNTMDWVTNQEDLISLTPRETTSRIILPPSGNVINLIALGTIFVIPGLVLISGIVVWVGRRRRG